MQKAQSWRSLLGSIISDPKEKQRIIEELNVTPITLSRWVNGDSDPRPQNLRTLVNVLPQYREQFLDLLKDERGGEEIPPLLDNSAIEEISSDFYEQVFVMHASTTENLRFWSMCHLILQQIIGQLDPERQGIAVWIVSCMPPSGPLNKVRSLREVIGLGTPPWPANLERLALFLGAESLVGNTITLCRPSIVQNLDAEHLYIPYARSGYEKSAAIYPILYAGRIAGVLLMYSAEYDHFLSPRRANLVQQYADLLALAFEPEDFYAPEDIALGIMPPPKTQQMYYNQHRRMLIEHMDAVRTNQQRVYSMRAELCVWQRLEDELLRLPASNEEEEY